MTIAALKRKGKKINLTQFVVDLSSGEVCFVEPSYPKGHWDFFFTNKKRCLW